MLNSVESKGKALIFSGWAILLFYFPSGLLHEWTGAYVYLRDIFLALHLFASLVFLQKQGQLQSLFSKAWLLGLLPLFLLPALFSADIRVEMGGYIKWSIIWLDCIVLGRLIAQYFQWNKAATGLSIITAFALLADLGTGYYEFKNKTLVLPMRGQLSPLGVEMGRDTTLKKFKRIKGLQRDVFSFANLMGLAVVAGICVCISIRNPPTQIGAAIWTSLFAFMLYNSGGRSAFFGVGAAGVVGIGLFFAPDSFRRHFAKIALGWLVIGLFMSCFGIGDFTKWFSSHFMKGSHIGDSGSAYARDENWTGVRTAIASVPIVLFTGSPLGSIIDDHVAPVFHWADNNYLWLLYHGSFISLAGIILYFRNALARPISSSRLWSKDCLLLFLLFVMGEAIARESLAFLGCIPLFIASGYVNGVRSPTTGEPPASSGKSRKSMGDASNLAERIARKAQRIDRLGS